MQLLLPTKLALFQDKKLVAVFSMLLIASAMGRMLFVMAQALKQRESTQRRSEQELPQRPATAIVQ